MSAAATSAQINTPNMSRRMNRFDYVSPSSLDEAVSALSEQDGASLIAGGTDLLAMMKLRAANPASLVNLKRIPGLDSICEEGGMLRIGALVKIKTILASKVIEQRCRALHESTLDFATPLIRNMATIGGNICRSSPGADTIPSLLAYGAELKLIGRGGERIVPLENFFTGPGQNVLDGEVLTEIHLRLPEGPTGSAFAKLTRNSGDLAKVNCAVAIRMSDGRCEDVRIALGAVADRPIRARAAEEMLCGATLDDRLIDAAADKAREETAPISDARSTARHRLRVTRVLVGRLLRIAVERAGQ